MKKVKKKSTENCHFYSREKSLYVAWACFRNALLKLEIKAYFLWPAESVHSRLLRRTDYENTPMQYTAIFHCCKNGKF